MLRCFAFVVVCAVFSSASVVSATDAKPRPLSKSEAEIISLNEELYAAYDRLHMRADKITEVAEQEKFYAENDPTPKFVDRLIEFERSHHGTHAGLMAARRLVLLGAGGGDPDYPGDAGRRYALKALRDYANAAELPEIIRYLAYGNVEPESEPLLRYLMNDPGVRDENRLFAKYMLARWSLTVRNIHENWERWSQELAAGREPRFFKEKEKLAKKQAKALPPQKLSALEREALEILLSFKTSKSDVRQPGIKGVDEHWHLIYFDPDKTKTMPLVKELAAGLLFKEQHLREGKPAPDLKLQLVSGEDWSLADQRGKTVIIQFSFKGCGPCEAMYPDLRELAAAHKEKLAILSIMVDEKKADTTDAVNSGKLAWNVHWDGDRGPIATQWAVPSFPTVYVIGPDGRIVSNGLRGNQLKAIIAELTR